MVDDNYRNWNNQKYDTRKYCKKTRISGLGELSQIPIKYLRKNIREFPGIRGGVLSKNPRVRNEKCFFQPFRLSACWYKYKRFPLFPCFFSFRYAYVWQLFPLETQQWWLAEMPHLFGGTEEHSVSFLMARGPSLFVRTMSYLVVHSWLVFTSCPHLYQKKNVLVTFRT